MSAAMRIAKMTRLAGANRNWARLALPAIAASAMLPLCLPATAQASVTAGVKASVKVSVKVSVKATTARIQCLLDHPVGGVVNLPPGTFAIRPLLRLKQGERIVGHHTTLKVAASSGNYLAVLAGASAGTDLSGLSISGVTFNQNGTGNPITDVQALYHGNPRFVILAVKGTGISVTGNAFTGINDVDTVVTGSATRQVTISGNSFASRNTPMHDHSTIYTSGTGTTIGNNTFTGSAMYDSAAIEVHGDQVTVTGNKVSGYFRAANIVADHTTFSGNTITGAGNPVDLWSVVAPGLHDVAVTGNTLNINRPYWTRVITKMGLVVPSTSVTQQVIRDAISTYPFQAITVSGNAG